MTEVPIDDKLSQSLKCVLIAVWNKSILSENFEISDARHRSKLL